MAKKIVIASGKGGVGKSTTAAGLGKALAKQGVNTLLIDCDAGLASLDTMLDGYLVAGCDYQSVVGSRSRPENAGAESRGGIGYYNIEAAVKRFNKLFYRAFAVCSDR